MPGFGGSDSSLLIIFNSSSSFWSGDRSTAYSKRPPPDVEAEVVFDGLEDELANGLPATETIVFLFAGVAYKGFWDL